MGGATRRIRRRLVPFAAQPTKVLHAQEGLVMIVIIQVGALYAGFCGVTCLLISIDLVWQHITKARASARAYFVATINIV